MDQIKNLRRGRRSAWMTGLLLAAVALGATALVAPDALAQAAGAAVSADDSTDVVQGRWEGLGKVAIVIALFVVPIFIGGWLAKQLKMPDHGWKFALAIGVIAAAAIVVSTGKIRLGPDLSGGIILVYELADESVNPPAAGDAADDDADDADAPANDGSGGTPKDETIAALIGVLTERIDPTGTKEISIRKYGDGEIEIIIPQAEPQELDYIQQRISTAGALVFRITASRRFRTHDSFIELAEALPPTQDLVLIDGTEEARWVDLDEKNFPTIEIAAEHGLVTRNAPGGPQALVLTNDELDVTGDYLRTVTPDVDEKGSPQVSFTFNSDGAFLFGRLTGEHTPEPSGARYNLGILLDNRLLSAPTIESKITDRGRISGGNMTEDEVQFLVGILQAGRLPAALNKTPIFKNELSPTLGAETVEKGKVALIASLALVAVFMAWYYRFAGVVSVVGLAINMLLIVGAMVLIKGAFTLPGLAGLVLTVGMSVDANVLIFERIREELKRGAALRMAIRNGYDRATTTIIDSNVTNLITGIVIYKIAPDNVKGFGITLVLGIAMSIFVAVFLTRIVFDVAERRRWISTLKMREFKFASNTNIDFLSWRRACIAASGIVIAVGLLAVVGRSRERNLLDIDFTGGSSVQFVLNDADKMPYADVFKLLLETPLKDNISLVEVGKAGTGTHYTVTTVNDDVNAVEEILQKTFGDKLRTYEVDISDVAPIPEGGAVGRSDPLRRRWFGVPPAMAALSLLQADESGAGAEPATDEQPAADQADGAADEAAEDSEPADAEATEPSAEEGDAAPAADETDEPAADESDGEAAADDASSDSDATEPAASDDDADAADPFAGGTSATLRFGRSDETGQAGGVSYDALRQLFEDALQTLPEDRRNAALEFSNPEYETGSSRNFSEWSVKIGLNQDDANRVFERIETRLDDEPVFPLSNKISGRVASRMAMDAVAAIILCLAGIIGYVWFRFHGVIYGVAAVVALVHDVLISLGAVAATKYLVQYVPGLASALMIDNFQISLTLVAAFLTIIGYSLNDTIVIFDRIREVKGKSPRLTAEMINAAVNQCLSRTILTAFTSLISVFVLYVVGGEGIHAFAFALLVGFIAGVYSTIYIANPVLLWLSDWAEAAAASASAKAKAAKPSAA